MRTLPKKLFFWLIVSIGVGSTSEIQRSTGEKLFWGDLNVHTIGNHTTVSSYDQVIGKYKQDLSAAYQHARTEARLDFCAITNFYPDLGGLQPVSPRSGPTPWEITRQVAELFNQPGTFVSFQGYEWFGADGDHTVLFAGDQPVIFPFSHLSLMIESLRGKRAILIPHQVSLPTHWTFYDPGLMPLVEISGAGKNAEEVMALPALERGYAIGFAGNSDCRDSRPGHSSLTAIMAKELTRESIWEALVRRHCYATSGERILLDVRVNGHGMGDSFEVQDLPSIVVKVAGTRPLEQVEVIRNGDVVYSQGSAERSVDFTFRDDGFITAMKPSNFYFVRVTQHRGKVERQNSQGMTDNWYFTGADWAWSSPVRVTPSRSLLKEWARSHGEPDKADVIATVLQSIADTQGHSRLDPYSDYWHQNLMSFEQFDAMPGEMIQASVEGNAVSYEGDRLNYYEQRPYWAPSLINKAKPSNIRVLEKQMLSSPIPARNALKELEKAPRSNGTLSAIKNHARAAALLAEADQYYLLGLLDYSALRNGLGDPEVADADLEPCLRGAQSWLMKSQEALREADSIITSCNPIPFTGFGGAVVSDRRLRLEGAQRTLAHIRMRGIPRGLPAITWESGKQEDGGIRRVGDGKASKNIQVFELDSGYLASAQFRSSRDLQLLEALAVRYGVALSEKHPCTTGDLYVRATYRDQGDGTLFLLAPSIKGLSKLPGPLLSNSNRWRTWVWHMQDGNFTPSGAGLPTITIGSNRSAPRLRSVCVYAPEARAQLVGRRILVAKIQPVNDNQIPIEVRLERDSDLEIGVYERGDNLLRPLAAQMLPAGIHHFSWDGMARDGRPAPAGEYEIRINSGFSGLAYLGLTTDPALPPGRTAAGRNDESVQDTFGCTYSVQRPRLRAGNYDLNYWCEKRDPRGKVILVFRIPGKVKALGDRPFYILGKNRNWLSAVGEGRWLLSACDVRTTSDPYFYVFKTEELSLWKPIYAETVELRVRIPRRLQK